MAINFYSSSSVNNFFSTSFGINNKQNGGGINDLLASGSLTEYSSIKSGSYKKLLNAYYAKEKNTIKEVDKTENVKNQEISINASDANSALIDLKKIEVSEENKTKIADKIKEFVNSYNDIVGKLVDSDTKSVLQKGVWMTKAVSSYSNLLNKVGIEVGLDNKLKFNEEKFGKTTIDDIESVFKGNMSVGSKISYKINQVENIAINNGTSNYTSKGKSINNTRTSIFDEYL